MPVYTRYADTMSPVRPFPALQCTAAMFWGSAESHAWRLSQKRFISSRGGTWWSSKGQISTRPSNFSGG